MIYGLYQSALGAQVQSLRQDVLANNLANAGTPAFKRDLLRIQSHPQEDALRGRPGNTANALRNLTGGVTPASTVTDFRTGPIQATNSPLDIALTGKAFLQVLDGEQQFLTRDGRLAVTPGGMLVTREQGLPILSTEGVPLTGLDSGAGLSIASDGTVSQNGSVIGQIALVEPEHTSELQKVGRGLYLASGRIAPAGPESRALQGHLEQSGVNPVNEMVELIEASRGYEANVNLIRTQDEALGRLLSSAARK